MMSNQGQASEDTKPRGVYSIDQILGMTQTARKNNEGTFFYIYLFIVLVLITI